MNSQGASTGYTVLVVADDAAHVTAALSRQSPSLSTSAVEASSDSSKILDRLSAVDCVVIDPAASDFDTVEMIREYDSSLPILLFTASDPSEFAEAALRADVTGYVSATDADAYETLLDRIETAMARFDRERATRESSRMQPLAAFTSELHACTGELEAIEMAADAATDILAFDRCSFGVERDGMLHVVEERGDEHGERDVLPSDEGIAGLTYQSGEPLLIDDVSTYPRTESGNEVALLSIPIGKHGVFQAVGDDTGVFTTEDHEAAVLLCDHLAETLSRIERENDLAKQERFFREVLNSTPDPVYILDDSLRFDTVNDALVEAVPYDRDQLAELSATEIPNETIDTDITAQLNELLESGGSFRNEIEVKRDDGCTPYQLNTRRLVHDGEPMLLGVARDISERKAREEELNRQNERLDEFASVVSHDLRTPLNVASGRIELAHETGDLSHLDTAEDALDRMTTLIQDALTLARDGRTVELPSPVALGPLVETAWQGVAAGDATISVPDESVMVLADEPRLQRCLENLLRNAVEHGNEPHIDVDVTLTDGQATLSICDDGPGIPPDEREDVLQSGYTTSDEGSGLGLSIVARIADAHGWTVSLSESDAGGLCVELSGIDLAV
ncbi:MAG: ATP-binding protein [Halobacteriales archaeon]|nr:ATP-binding protein [Halobacteriales archaeon]